MRCGCIAIIETIKCDGCGRFLEYCEQYLMIKENEDEVLRFCTECCLSRGYARYIVEKGKNVITFLAEE